jgi:hypothetical protein
MVNDDWHERLAPEDVSKFIENLRTGGARSLTGCHLHVEKS